MFDCAFFLRQSGSNTKVSPSLSRSICDVRPAMDENQKKRLAALMRVGDAEGKMGVLIKELSGKAVKA